MMLLGIARCFKAGGAIWYGAKKCAISVIDSERPPA
jgi:hypothetical protein